MVYMHKVTYEITSALPETAAVNDTAYAVPADEWIALDEYLALPVQALNRKGFLVTSCRKSNAFAPRILLPLFEKGNVIGWDHENAYTGLFYGVVVDFAEDYAFETLPEGFTETRESRENGTVFTRFIRDACEWEGDAKTLLDVLTDACASLNAWAQELPES